MTELIGKLVSNLNIDETQAKGALGSILNLAKDKLDGADFSKVSELIDGSDDLLNAAPKAEGLGGMLGGITSALGVNAGSLGDLAGLASQFKSLNLDADMIGKFTPIITGFLQDKGGDSLKQIVAKFLG